MEDKFKNIKRILIIGDAGRGKTTLAHKISEKLKIPFYSTDDFYWKKKFSIPNDKEGSIMQIKSVYEKEAWIVEGSTTHLFQHGLDKADLIIYLKFKNIILQWRSLINRNKRRENESLLDLIKFLIYVTRKRYGIGYKKVKTNKELLKPFSYKIIELKSISEINRFIGN